MTRFVEGSASDILTVKEAEIVFHKVRLRIAIALAAELQLAAGSWRHSSL